VSLLLHSFIIPFYSSYQFLSLSRDILMAVSAQQTVDIGEPADWDQFEELEVPQQRNGTDCGIFALLFALYRAEGRGDFNFDQRHMAYCRRQICHDFIAPLKQEGWYEEEEAEVSIKEEVPIEEEVPKAEVPFKEEEVPIREEVPMPTAEEGKAEQEEEEIKCPDNVVPIEAL
jgi:hypothetical protein